VVPPGLPGGDKEEGSGAFPVSSLERSPYIGQGRSSRYGSARLPALPEGVMAGTQRPVRQRETDVG